MEKLSQESTNLKKELTARDTCLNEMEKTANALTEQKSRIQEDFNYHRKLYKSFAEIRDDIKTYLGIKSFQDVKGKFTTLETGLALTRGEKEELEENLESFKKKWNKVANI